MMFLYCHLMKEILLHLRGIRFIHAGYNIKTMSIRNCEKYNAGIVIDTNVESLVSALLALENFDLEQMGKMLEN